jgi:hypothetical protein
MAAPRPRLRGRSLPLVHTGGNGEANRSLDEKKRLKVIRARYYKKESRRRTRRPWRPAFICGCKVTPAADIQIFSFSWFIVCDYSSGPGLGLSEALFVACRLLCCGART